MPSLGHRNPGPISKEAAKTPLGRALLAAGAVNWGDENVRPDKVFVRAYGPEGISARVFSASKNAANWSFP